MTPQTETILACAHCHWAAKDEKPGLDREEVDVRMGLHERICPGKPPGASHRVITRQALDADSMVVDRATFKFTPQVPDPGPIQNDLIIYCDSDSEEEDESEKEEEMKRKIPWGLSDSSSSDGEPHSFLPQRITYTLTFRPVLQSLRSQQQALAMRQALESDPGIVPGTIRPWSVECRGCRNRIQVTGRAKYCDQAWRAHKAKCISLKELIWTVFS
ncbi:hypothetical protein C8J56DRAFT_474500 [Mycena floridula]|nr:hypothetical protein C8J56DRAFT_474500 [Mycena floridula]